MKVLDNLSRKVLAIGYLILLGMIILPCLVGFIYPDFWWQLKEGTHILYNWKFPQTPLNAFGFASNPLPHEYFFYEILIASIHRLLGFFGLRIFFFVIAFFPFAYALGWITKKHRWNFANFYLLSFACFLLIFRIQQRPELLSNVFLVFILHLLFIKDLRASPYFLIMLLWANTHASFIIGLGAVGLWIANDIWLYRKKNIFPLAKVGFASLAGSVFNPSGAAYLLEPFKLQSASWSRLTSTEMLPATAWCYPFILVAVILSVAVIYKTGWKHQLWFIIILAGSTILSLISQRYINLLGCLLCVLVFVNARAGDKFTGTKKIADFAVTTFILIPSLIFLASFFLPMLAHNFFKKDYAQRFGAAIIRALPDENKKILTGIRTGAYINGTTENLRTFLDTGFNRFNQDNIRYYYYLDNVPEAFHQALDQLQISYIMVNKTNQYWNFVLSEHPQWEVVQIEPQAVLYVKRDQPDFETSKRMILWDDKESKFYEPKRFLVQETLRNINSGDLWREGKCYSFFAWWLKKQSPAELEKFLNSTADIQPTLELVLREELRQLELSKLSEKKYASKGPFDNLIKARILYQHGNFESARQQLQDICRQQDFSSWEAEVLTFVCSESKFTDLIWSEPNFKWFFEFTDQLNKN